MSQMAAMSAVLTPRGRRRTRIDPAKIDINEVTGDENVAVINRETGKRITGAKAPPLKHLTQWLEKNPGFDVDPKWSHIVKLKVSKQLQYLCDCLEYSD